MELPSVKVTLSKMAEILNLDLQGDFDPWPVSGRVPIEISESSTISSLQGYLPQRLSTA